MNAEKFNALSDKDKRIALAKDVIKHIKGDKFKVKSNNGYFVSDEISTILDESEKEFSLQKLIKKVDDCVVCAQGALFLCDIKARNQFSITQNLSGIDDDSIMEHLTYFSKEQLSLIEVAFERFPDYIHSHIDIGLRIRARDFGYRWNIDDYRLIGIMENIIVNDGEFIP